MNSMIEYSDRNLLAIKLSENLSKDIQVALSHRDRVSVVVPGGTTPGPVFDKLCRVDLDWARVNIILSDERWVPETCGRSNSKLLRQRLLVEKASAARFVPLYLPARRPKEAIDELSKLFGSLLPISVALIGMGADMHTASLFPGAEGLEHALTPDGSVLQLIRSKEAREMRVTLTVSVLNSASKKHLVIMGDEKRKAFNRATTLSPTEAPIRAIMDNLLVHWAS